MSVTSAPSAQLEALHALARAAAGGEFRARTLLQRICAAVGDALEFERVAIFRYVAESDIVMPFAAHGAAEAEVVRVPAAIPLDRLPAFRAARSSGRALFVRDAAGEEAFSELAVELLGLHSLVIVPLISEGRCFGFLCADRSGTEFMLGHAELELLTTIGTFTAAFLDRAIEQSDLRRLNELKSQFIALASHELRTPAASIYGISATIDERWETLTPEHRDELRLMLHQQADRLRRLVEQLLDLSQIEAEEIRILPTRLPIAAHLNELADSVAGDQRENVMIEAAPDLEALIDPVAFDRILSNLIVNALRHGEPPVHVRAKRTESELRVTVEDHGSGVPPEFLPNLFERFARAHTSVKGAGLGLSIAQSYARAHGGHIGYEQAESNGARFTVVLSAWGSETVSASASKASAS
jgi:signal transduction histidine kinase